jgi:hypothetical protein
MEGERQGDGGQPQHEHVCRPKPARVGPADVKHMVEGVQGELKQGDRQHRHPPGGPGGGDERGQAQGQRHRGQVVRQVLVADAKWGHRGMERGRRERRPAAKRQLDGTECQQQLRSPASKGSLNPPLAAS